MDVSFAARLGNVMALKAAIAQASNTLDSVATQAQAKDLEEQIYSRAASKGEYEAVCAREIDSLKQQIDVKTELAESEGEELDPEAPDLGPYKRATFYRNGLFSAVFKGGIRDPIGDRPAGLSNLVALKVTTPSTMKPPHDSEREARILQEASSESIIPLLSTLWQPGGRFVLVFPFMPIDLERLMHRSMLKEAHAKPIIRDLFRALSHLHSLDIIHRDVKPSNILLRSSNGPAYLADFGIAWSPNDSASEPATNKITDVGTTSYRPPELLFGYSAYETSLDLWAAGCTVAEMVRPDHQSLFDGGDLGSELALIGSIFSTLGTPNEELWPSAKRFPDWGKMRFVKYPPKPWVDILNQASELAVNFVSCLVQYEPSHRMHAAQALEHPLLQDMP